MNYKPFDIEKAKAGAKVVTRDGRAARIICYDKKVDDYPMLALIVNERNGKEETFSYSLKGEALEGEIHNLDLFLLPGTKRVWIILDESGIAHQVYNRESFALRSPFLTPSCRVVEVEIEI